MESIDELIESMPASRRAKIRQRVIQLIETMKGESDKLPSNVASLKRHREKKRNGR
jgi:hypothetical protein